MILIGQGKFESCHSDQKSVDFVGGFFIQADRLGISSRDSVYIIAASCGAYHHTVGVYISIGLMRYSGFATDDMQN